MLEWKTGEVPSRPSRLGNAIRRTCPMQSAWPGRAATQCRSRINGIAPPGSLRSCGADACASRTTELRPLAQEYGILDIAILLLCIRESIAADGREVWRLAR